MANSQTITSLAILKVHFDEYGADYLDHLLPFVRYCIAKAELQVVSSVDISEHIAKEFGLIIPEYVCDTVLKRLTKPKHGYLTKQAGSYIVRSELDTSTFEERKSDVANTVSILIEDIDNYAREKFGLSEGREVWERVLIAFLANYTIDCVKSYSRKSPLPQVDLGDSEQRLLYVLAKRLEILREQKIDLWGNFETLVKGRMLANALVCEDIANISKKFNHVDFYIDTPMVIRLLGLDEDYKVKCSEELIDLVRKLGGKWYIFNHTFEETENVMSYVVKNYNNAHMNGGVVKFARANGISASDLELIKGSIEAKLNELGILKIATPRYVSKYQISEADLKEQIEDEVRYFNPRALEYDINSIRSILVQRKGGQPQSLEECGHVFVTPNAGIAKTAWNFARKDNPGARVSPVISDYSLVNIAWLKLPMEAPDLASLELMASCYAAMEPREPLWSKYYDEIERLRQKGDITEEDHYLLRHSSSVQSELMDLTQGMEGSLTTQRVETILDNLKQEMVASEKEKLAKAQTVIDDREQKLNSQETSVRNFCSTIASVIMGVVNLLIILIVIMGAYFSIPGVSESPTGIRYGVIVLAAIYGVTSAIWGISIFGLGKKAKHKLENLFVARFLNK